MIKTKGTNERTVVVENKGTNSTTETTGDTNKVKWQAMKRSVMLFNLRPVMQKLYFMMYDPKRESAAAFTFRFEDIITLYNSHPYVENLSENECRMTFYYAVAKNCSMLRYSFWIHHYETNNFYSFDDMKTLLLRDESIMRPVPPKRAMVCQLMCYVCGKAGHKARQCIYAGTGLRRCYECHLMSSHTAKQRRKQKGADAGENRRFKINKKTLSTGRGYVQKSKFSGRRRKNPY